MIALLMVSLNAEDSEAANQISGECGQDATDTTPATHVTFSFDESTGVMTINGDGAMKDYGNIADRPWNSYKDDIKTVVITGVSSVGKYAFDGCSSLQSILLGDSVTEIKDFAFQHCESLTYVDLNKVETLHTQTFFDCKNLKDVVINESTKRIGMQSFEDCISLESIIVPDSITYLGSNVFDYSSLKRISVGNGLSSAVFNKLNHSFNGPMYDTDGTTELNRDGVKGCVFLKVDGKLVKQETYRATFVVNSSNWKILQYGVGETIASPTPTKDGQTFERWNPALPATMPAENVTFNAVWSVKLTIKCVDMNGNPIAEDIIRNIECGSEYREEAPVIVGYVPEEQILEGKVNDEDSTVYLVYKHCYEIVFDPNNGDEPSRYSVEEGKTVAEPTNPIKEGFTFEGWLLNGVEYDFNKPVTSNITLVAKWATIQYTITIAGEGVTVKNGEDIIASGTTVDYDTILTIILSEKTGHTGTVKVGDEVINGIWTVKGDVTFTGSYSINSYKITFDTDGGSEIPEMTIEFDGTVATPENPTKEGYTFAGWDKEIPATMPAENLTIKATWIINQYTITIVGEGVTVKNGDAAISNGDKVNYSTELTITIAEKEGYTGIVKIGDAVVSGSWKVTENITVTGAYTENPEDSKSDSNTLIITGVVVTIIVVAIVGFFIINRH